MRRRLKKLTENDDVDLLRFLEDQNSRALDAAKEYAGRHREENMDAYMRRPYGNERDGLSRVVASDVFDTVEGILPNLLEIFVGSNRAVQFEPETKEDIEICEQSTDLCNYIFWRQNNGYLVLQSAFKDALILRSGHIKWGWEEKIYSSFLTKRNQTEMDLAVFLSSNQNYEIIEKSEADPVQMENGEFVKSYNVKLKKSEIIEKVRIDCVPPENLIFTENWNSPYLDDCPYVCHAAIKSFSDMIEMGLDVTAEDVKKADQYLNFSQNVFNSKENSNDYLNDESTQDALIKSYLLEEYVLYDKNEDGIAERRKIIRLGKKILSNEECSHVPISMASPYLISHKAIGIAHADVVDDIQRMKTDIQRQMLDNLSYSNMPQRKVVVDSLGNPKANIDDLLNPMPGGVIRINQPGAVEESVMSFTGSSALPVVEYLDGIKENRTGYTRYNQGLDANSLNKTKGGMQMLMNASQRKLMSVARNFAEFMIAPMFIGVMKTLTENGMGKTAFKLRNKFIEVDPSEWVNKFNIQVNVGLGNGDAEQKAQMLEMIDASQQRIIQGGGMNKLLTEKNIYKLQAAKLDNAGFKNVDDFWLDPESLPPPDPNQPPPPDPDFEKMQMQMQSEAMKFQAQSQLEIQKKNMDIDAKLQIESQSIASKERIAMAEMQSKHVIELNRNESITKPLISIDGKEVFAQAGDQLKALASEQNSLISDALFSIQKSQEQTAILMQQVMSVIAAPKQATLSNGKTITVQTIGVQ